MRINNTGNGFSLYNMQNENKSDRVPDNISAKNGQVLVKISISEEGKRNYRNSLGQESENVEDIINRRQDLLSGKYMPETDFTYELGNKLAAYEEKDKYISTEDKAYNLLKAYASVYDEIVQGYESGTRERYTEEINSLNAVFKRYADNLEVQAQQAPKIVEAYEKYMTKLSKIGMERAELATKAQDVFARVKSERPLENISQKIIASSKVFVEQYAEQNLRSMGIESILKNITIF